MENLEDKVIYGKNINLERMTNDELNGLLNNIIYQKDKKREILNEIIRRIYK